MRPVKKRLERIRLLTEARAECERQFQAKVDELIAALAERDKLREALERIAAHPHGGILVNIARAALGEAGTE